MSPIVVQPAGPSTSSPRPIGGSPDVTSSEHERVKQLVALVRSELDGSGQLSAIKAQLASTASKLVLCKRANSLKPSTAQIPEPTLSILAECLSYYGFRHSLNTLLAESGVSKDRLLTRPQLSKEIGVKKHDETHSGSFLDVLTKLSPTMPSNGHTVNAPNSVRSAPSQPASACDPIGTSTRTPPSTLAPVRTAGDSLPTSLVTAPSAAGSVPGAIVTNPTPPASSPPTQPSTSLANAAAARPHTTPPLTPLPPTPPKVATKDIALPQPTTLTPLVHPIKVRSQALDPEPRSVGTSPQSPGALDLSQISSVPSQITSEDLVGSGRSSPASTSVLSTEDYSVSVSVAQAAGMGGEFRGLGLENKRQVGAWLTEKEFHTKP